MRAAMQRSRGARKGYRLIDTAAAYQNEEALPELPLPTWRRPRYARIVGPPLPTYAERLGLLPHRSFFRAALEGRARAVFGAQDVVHEYLIDQANLRGF